jgi:predicted nucleic acid-binding protein
MKITDRLREGMRLFLDTAPVVYYVEANQRYLPLVEAVFNRLDDDLLVAVTSPVTLAEYLVAPYRLDRPDLRQTFADLITSGPNTLFVSIDEETADQAAALRARYNLTLLDAFQIAVALVAGCNAFLTNNVALKRVAELEMIVLDEVEPG